MTNRAFIAGLSGLELSPEERSFFREARPWGFILFRRNVDSPRQVRALCDALRDVTGQDDTPILVDQEGGRVQRLGPPHWPRYPSGRTYGSLHANDPIVRREIVRLGGRLLAHDLLSVGINVDCMPVLDVPVPGAHDVIGDRAYGRDPAGGGGARARGGRRAARRRRSARRQAHPGPWARRRRQPPVAAGRDGHPGGARGPRLRAVPDPGRHAARHDGPCRLRGPRRRQSGDHLATDHR